MCAAVGVDLFPHHLRTQLRLYHDPWAGDTFCDRTPDTELESYIANILRAVRLYFGLQND
jgi:hypothetical protein